MIIPIRNLYFLLLYAWDYLDSGDAVNVGALESNQPIDLLAYVLAKGVERVLKRGLDREYSTSIVETARIRGQIDFPSTLKTGALARSRLTCRVDELGADVLQNRIVKSTLRQLAETDEVDRDLRRELFRLYQRMGPVAEVRISLGLFSQVRISRNNRFYRLLLSICRLVHEGLVVDERGEGRRFLAFERDEQKMRLVFESFVRNLLRRRLGASYTVSGRRLDWQETSGSSYALSLLPTLNMDVVVEGRGRTLIVDTKYSPKALSSRFSVDRFRASHLYQLFAYLQNYAVFHPQTPVDGLLLYPAIGGPLDESFQVMGHRVRVAMVDLGAEWQSVERSLVAFVEEATFIRPPTANAEAGTEAA